MLTAEQLASPGIEVGLTTLRSRLVGYKRRQIEQIAQLGGIVPSQVYAFRDGGRGSRIFVDTALRIERGLKAFESDADKQNTSGMAQPKVFRDFTLTPWQARALYALTDVPMTASQLLINANYAKCNGLYPHQRRELQAMSPALLTISAGSHGPLYARTPLGAEIAHEAFPTPPVPPRRGGNW